MQINKTVRSLLVAALLAGGLGVAAESVSAAETSRVMSACNDGNINNGEIWYDYVGGGGKWKFYEYGDKLMVSDFDSDGARVWAEVMYCSTSGNHVVGRYSSGPNEGPEDVETYKLNQPEGQVMWIRARNGDCWTCGGWTSWVRVNA